MNIRKIDKPSKSVAWIRSVCFLKAKTTSNCGKGKELLTKMLHLGLPGKDRRLTENQLFKQIIH